MKDPLFFKHEDLLWQIAIPGIVLVGLGFMFAILVLGIVQVHSCYRNRRGLDDAYKAKGRKHYEQMLIIVLIFLGLLGTYAFAIDSADILRLMIMIIGLIAPFMALWYFAITRRELKKIKTAKQLL